MSKIDVILAYPLEPQEPPELAPPGPSDLVAPDLDEPGNEDELDCDEEDDEAAENSDGYILSGDADTPEAVAAHHDAAKTGSP